MIEIQDNVKCMKPMLKTTIPTSNGGTVDIYTEPLPDWAYSQMVYDIMQEKAKESNEVINNGSKN